MAFSNMIYQEIFGQRQTAQRLHHLNILYIDTFKILSVTLVY